MAAPLDPAAATAAPPVDYQEAAATKPMASTVPKYYDTGPEIRDKMLELIEGAKDYILIDSFLVVTQPDTMKVMEALKNRRSSGVKIYVLADSASHFKRPGEGGFRYLREADIPCAEYNPMRLHKLLIAPVMLPRDHRKFWIVDGKVLFFGGANILGTSLNPPEQGGNHDIMVAVESSEAIEQMIESFVLTWNQYSRQKLRKESFPVKSGHAKEARLWLLDQNRLIGRPSVISQMVGDLFSIAKDEVWLIQPYTFVTAGLLEQLRALTDRAVEVNLILSDGAEASRFRYASYYGIKDVLEAGGKVWIYKPQKGILHTKAMIIDGRYASVGSANLNLRSYYLSMETNVVFDDPKSVKEMVHILDELKLNCRAVGADEAENYRGLMYYFTWLGMQWAG